MTARTVIGRVGIDRCDLAEATVRILDRAAAGDGADVHLVNASSVAAAQDNSFYAECLNSSWLNLSDGRPLTWVSRLKEDGPPLTQVRGADLMRSVCAAGVGRGVRHFLLGSTDETLAALAGRLERDYPGAIIVGAESRPFRALSRLEQVEELERIRASGAQVVWVGLGSTYQDLEAASLARDLGAVCIGIGAAFDFIAGTFRESPRWVIALGLEWLYRLVQEPSRLWRRYLFGNLGFLRAALSGHLRERRRIAGDGK